MYQMKFRLALALGLVLVIWSLPLLAQSFSTIQLRPRSNPEGWENARRYEIGYFTGTSDAAAEVNPPNPVKLREIDLVLAGIVKDITAREYDPARVTIDNQQVATITAGGILDLTGTDFPTGSKAWSAENRAMLTDYLQKFPQAMLLYKFDIRITSPEGIIEQTIPLILRLKQTPYQPDLLTIFFVTTRTTAPDETIPQL
jgi:hypothetical protein